MTKPATDEASIDVFFIGVGKCGTSWIYRHLTRRGDIGVPEIKEPYVLNNSPEDQAAVVAKLYGSKRPRCDFSNVYYWDESIPAKVIENNPNAKIVLTVRKPSKRIASHFAFLQRNGEHVDSTVGEYLAAGDPHELVARSDYQRIFDRFSEVVDSDRILVLSLEQLADDVQTYADRLAEFLEVETRVVDAMDTEKVLGRSSARFPAVSRMAKKAAEVLREQGYLKVLSRFKESALIRRALFQQVEGAQDQDVRWPAEVELLDSQYAEFLAAHGS